MKANELAFPSDPSDCPPVTFLRAPKSQSHYKSLLMLGRCFPATASQAKHFIKVQGHFDVFTETDAKNIEAFLNKHGLQGDYVHTASRRWARLINMDAMYAALRKEYGLRG